MRRSHSLVAPVLPRILPLILFALSIFDSFASAIPLFKRQSVGECKAWFTVPPVDSSVFYTGGTAEQAEMFAANHEPRLYILADLFNPPPDVAETDQFWDNCSQAFAELSSGVTYVLIPPQVVMAIPDVWGRVEYGALVANPMVTMIIWVNPTNFQDQLTLWPCPGGGGTMYAPCPDTVVN